jgi:hypothetical protein
MTRFVALLLPLLMLISPTAGATSSPPPTLIHIEVLSNPLMGFRTWRVLREQAAVFGASLEFRGGFLPNVDLYFGFLLPGNTKPHTWTLEENVPVLAQGMRPLLADIDLDQPPPVMTTAQIAGGEIEYTFAADDPVGMYTVFVMAVIAGTDPADPRNWHSVGTSPLFVE